jgi:pimeloyl-ACP methyl ester carboxylesterase
VTAPVERRPQFEIDPRWALAASLLHSFERSSLARTGLLAAAVAGGIRLETGMRTLGAALDADDRAPRLPNWHETGTGPAVVLVNGWSASGLVWPAELVERLGRHHRVIRIDNRGTGWSRRMRHPFTIADLARDVVAVLDELGIERTTIVGISMGGMIAQEVALRHPDRVRSLVLLGSRPPNPEYTAPPPITTARLMTGPAPGQPLREFMRHRWAAMTGPGFVDAHPEAIGEMVRSIVARPTPRESVLHQARAIAAWHGAGRLRRLGVPTTVVHGDADPLIPVRNGMRLAQLIPRARYVELSGVGHLVPYEAPALTAQVVEAATGAR